MKVVYVAGPYSAPNSWEREQQIRKAEQLSLQLIDAGAFPICVHTMARFWFGRVPEERAIAWGIALLRPSDAVVLVEGWQQSNGTLAEMGEAFKCNIPVYEHVHAFIHGYKLLQGPPDSASSADLETSWNQAVGRAKRATGTNCSVCGLPQYTTPSGDVCDNGHGGAPPA